MRTTKKFKIISLISISIIVLVLSFYLIKTYRPIIFENIISYIPFTSKLKVPNEVENIDRNTNKIPDALDIVNEARKEAKNKTKYIDAYYVGGYPPETEGVCTDVIWRGLKALNYDLKASVDSDIEHNLSAYPRVENKPDPNIDFRRVKNLDIFLSRNFITLSNEIIPNNPNNLKNWQPGDIIVTYSPYEHIFILSDKRASNGIPYIIHNTWPQAEESYYEFFNWEIAGHYRYKY
ncbi:MAG: DUF1287 domain-containing protein [Clostridiaceae bacterium]